MNDFFPWERHQVVPVIRQVCILDPQLLHIQRVHENSSVNEGSDFVASAVAVKEHLNSQITHSHNYVVVVLA